MPNHADAVGTFHGIEHDLVGRCPQPGKRWVHKEPAAAHSYAVVEVVQHLLVALGSKRLRCNAMSETNTTTE